MRKTLFSLIYKHLLKIQKYLNKTKTLTLLQTQRLKEAVEIAQSLRNMQEYGTEEQRQWILLCRILEVNYLNWIHKGAKKK